MTPRTLIGSAVILLIVRTLAQSSEKLSANDSADIENLRQLGLGSSMYAADFDDRGLLVGWDCVDKDTQEPATCPEYLAGGIKLLNAQGEDLSPESRTTYYWWYILAPYMRKAIHNPNNALAFWPKGKNSHWFDAPDAKGLNVGGQNSYGYNFLNLSPKLDASGLPTSPTMVNAIPRPASTILFADATFDLIAPDVSNEAHLRKLNYVGIGWTGSEANFADVQGQFYSSYWKNIGGSDWSYGYSNRQAASPKLDPDLALRRMGALNNSGKVFAITADQHILRLSPIQITADICYWSTDHDGFHPKCP